MIKILDGDKYIEGISIEQELTFDTAKEVFQKKGLSFGEKEYITLGLRRKDGRYSNLALLLSEQCTHTTKVAIFEGTTKSIFRDRKEFSGSLFTQLEEVYKYLDFYNKTNATFQGLERIDKRDYPEMAVREALLNALIHREYSFGGSILVNLYDDRLEIVSLGGIVPGLTLYAVLSGISQTRNEKLAFIFYRLRFVEAYGTGIPRIMDCYANDNRKPKIQATDGSFVLILPNRNEVTRKKELTTQEEIIWNCIQLSEGISRKEIIDITKIGSTHCYTILNSLLEKKLIVTKKRGKELIYFVK